MCSTETSPDRRLLVGPRSEPCRNSRPPAFRPSLSQEAHACKERSVLCFPGSLAGRVPSGKYCFYQVKCGHISDKWVRDRQQDGGGWEGCPRAEVDPQSLDQKGAQWASDRTCHRARAAPHMAGPRRCASLCHPPPARALLSLARGSLRWYQAWRGSRRAAGRGGGLTQPSPHRGPEGVAGRGGPPAERPVQLVRHTSRAFAEELPFRGSVLAQSPGDGLRCVWRSVAPPAQSTPALTPDPRVSWHRSLRFAGPRLSPRPPGALYMDLFESLNSFRKF